MRYRLRWNTDSDTDEILILTPIPIPIRYRYRYRWNTDMIPIPIPMKYRYRWDTDMIPMRYRWDTDELPMRCRWATDEIPVRYRYRCQWYTDNDTEFKVSDTHSVRAKRDAKNIYTTCARCARSARILYYLWEPPGAAFNTTFNGAILSISRKNFYTTSARLPPKRPILLLTEQY